MNSTEPQRLQLAPTSYKSGFATRLEPPHEPRKGGQQTTAAAGLEQPGVRGGRLSGSGETTSVLTVAGPLHEGGPGDMRRLQVGSRRREFCQF